MQQDQNPQNIYRPLILNQQQYQGANTQVEPINYYGPQNNQLLPNQQYQPQIQQYQPQILQYDTQQQYQQPYYIMDPNIIPVNSLPQSDKIKDQTEIEQTCFLAKMTTATLIQQISQVIFCMFCIYDRNISKNFYDFENQHHNFVVYLCFFLLIGIIITAKFTKIRNDKSMAIFMFLCFAIIFDLFAGALVSGCNQGLLDSEMHFFGILWFLYFIEGYLTFLTFLVIIIQLKTEKKIPNITTYFGKIVGFQCILFVIGIFTWTVGFLGAIIFVGILIVASIPFTLFYLYNMNCIIKGSGNLNKDQFLLGAILVYFTY